MRTKNTTKVIIPLFNQTYWLPIFTTFYYRNWRHKTPCEFKAPFYLEGVYDKVTSDSAYPGVYKYTNYIEAIEEHSGVYTVSCMVNDWDNFGQRNWVSIYYKSLNITFIRGRLIWLV